MTEPWECTETWKDEKAFLNWLRSQTRRIWSRHPIKLEMLKRCRVKAPLGKEGKLVWACRCDMCKELNKQSDIEIDHIIPGGSFRSWQEYTEWAKRILWVGFDDLRVLCKKCHQLVNLSQKLGISLDEAKVEKIRIEFFKQPVAKQKTQLVESGATEEEIKNNKSRLTAFYKYIIKSPTHQR